jgi:hypothetical protein
VGVYTPPSVSPWVQQWDDNFGKLIRLSVAFNVTTRAITGVTVFRDPGCQWTHVLIGVGADGVPDHSEKAISVPEGTTVLTAQQLNVLANRGLSTIDDFNLNLTAGL